MPEPPVPGEPPTDTVGNPIVFRGPASASDGPSRHSAPDAGPTRAERRMLEFVAEGRIERTETGTARSSFWRVDRAFATETKTAMLDWLREEGYIEVGHRTGVRSAVLLTERGRALLGDE